MSSDNFNVFDIFGPKDFEDISRIKSYAKNLFHSGIPATLSEHGILAGGAFTSWVHNEDAKDYDIFLLDTPANRQMFDNWFITTLIPNSNYIKKTSTAYFNKNSNITSVWTDSHYRAQYIWTRYQTREELIADFDLLHTKVSYTRTADGDKLYISKQTLDAIRAKKLIPTGKQKIRVERLNKFFERGWSIDDKGLEIATTGTISVGTSGTITSIAIDSAGTNYNNFVVMDSRDTNKWSIDPYTMQRKNTIQPAAVNSDKVLSDKQIKELIDEFYKPRKPVEKEPPKLEKSPSWFEEFKKSLIRSWDT